MKTTVTFLLAAIPIWGWPELAATASAQETQGHGSGAIVEEEIPDDGTAPAGGDLAELESRARELFAVDDLEGAGAIYRQLARSHGEDGKKAEMLLFVAWIEHLLDHDDVAADVLTDALVTHPDLEFRSELFTAGFRDLYLEAQTKAVEKRGLEAYELVDSGLKHLRARDYAASRQAFEAALAYRGDHPQAIYNLALVSLYEGRQEEALGGFQKLLALAETRDEEQISTQMRGLALTNVGYLYNRRQLYREAEEALEKAVELYPSNASAWSNLGVSRRRLGKRVPAAEAFRRAHELKPDDPGVMNNLALAYIDTEDWMSAVALLKGATDRHPENASMWLNFGLAQLGLGNTSGAVESFESAIRFDPENAQGWASAAAVHLANHYLSAGDHARVLETAERVLSWQRDSSEGWVYRGLAQREMGDFEAARTSLEEARRLDPTRAQTYNNLGSVYFELRLLEQAEEAFRRAIAIDPGLAEARENLAAVQAMHAGQPSNRDGLPDAASATRPPPRAVPPPPSPPPPPPPRARLGLRYADIDYSALGLKGVMVESVVPGTLAGRADIRPKDLILKVDGRDITSAEDLESYVRQTDKASVVLDLLRDSRPKKVEMSLD